MNNKKQVIDLIKKIVPWLFAAGILAFLFQKYSFKEVWQATQHANLLFFIPISIFYFLFVSVIDCWGLSWALSRFVKPISFKEMIAPRFVSYLFAIVNYNAGQACLAHYLKKNHQSPGLKSLGSLVLMMVIDLFLLVSFALLGSFFIHIEFQHVDFSLWIKKFAAIFYLGFFLFIAYWAGNLAKLFPKGINKKISDWFSRKHFFAALNQASLKDYFIIAVFRLPIHIAVIISLYFIFHSFNAHVPLTTLMAIAPMILLLGAVPITPGGLGTMQAATVALLSPHLISPLIQIEGVNAENLVFALSLLWVFANYILKALTGLFFIKKVELRHNVA